MKINTPVEQALDLVEQCFEALSSVLIAGESDALVASSEKLQQAAVYLASLVNRASSKDPQTQVLKLRLVQLSKSLGVRRESLIKRSVLVDRALNALVPATVKSTYGKSPKAYGSLGPQTGAFKHLEA